MKDLRTILATIDVDRRPGVYTFLTLSGPVPTALEVHATIVEDEGLTVVATADSARASGHRVEFEAAWLTLEVHSALDAVGLTAAVSDALARRGIPCNVLAGCYHDHLLVPVDRADDAVGAIVALRRT